MGRSDRARGGGGTWRWRVVTDLTVGALAPPMAEPVPLPFFPSPYLRLAAISGVRRLAPHGLAPVAGGEAARGSFSSCPSLLQRWTC